MRSARWMSPLSGSDAMREPGRRRRRPRSAGRCPWPEGE
ncbi:hypothetical protein RAJCM14343_3640 [Rhodococcus aetherivorans]|uniref:Uncharacterized protein n=1 Tax=Rhodococcus aetherivorans TaxID=191292 RepID=A0ABQ0YPN1_9NOCA|nr:hypothetical protein RAJCM14343_3640 [Rhodococcus aetherivorans]CCW13815.1 hypothetical protein EBESD8_43780 [Rhodococcus aetherivorans]